MNRRRRSGYYVHRRSTGRTGHDRVGNRLQLYPLLPVERGAGGGPLAPSCASPTTRLISRLEESYFMGRAGKRRTFQRLHGLNWKQQMHARYDELLSA
jgi:hypothetical protein